MQADPRYDDVVSDVKAFLEERLAAAVAAGIAEERIQLDPGIGFGKTLDAQPRAAAPPRRARRARPAGRRRHLAQVVPRPDHRPRGRRPAAGDDRHERARARARAPPSSASTTCAPVARRARGGGCYGPRRDEPDDDDDEYDDDELDDGTRTTSPEPSSRSRSPASRSTPTTASPRPSARSASGSCSTCGSRSASATRRVTDRVEDTVDYGEVCQAVALVAQQRSYKTLERLCAAIADRLLDDYEAESVWVQGGEARAADPAAGRGGLGRGLARGGVSDAAERDRLPRPRLQRRRPPRPARGRGRRAAAPRRRGARLLLDVRDRAGRRGPRPARLPQRLRAGRDRARARGAARRLQGGRARARAASPAARATGRGRSTSTCCCSATCGLRAPSASPAAREVTSRRFVLVPLLELDPELTMPDGGRRCARRARPALGAGVRTCAWTDRAARVAAAAQAGAAAGAGSAPAGMSPSYAGNRRSASSASRAALRSAGGRRRTAAAAGCSRRSGGRRRWLLAADARPRRSSASIWSSWPGSAARSSRRAASTSLSCASAATRAISRRAQPGDRAGTRQRRVLARSYAMRVRVARRTPTRPAVGRTGCSTSSPHCSASSTRARARRRRPGSSGGSGTSSSSRCMIAREPTTSSPCRTRARHRRLAEAQPLLPARASAGGQLDDACTGWPLSCSARSTAAQGCEPWMT